MLRNRLLELKKIISYIPLIADQQYRLGNDKDGTVDGYCGDVALILEELIDEIEIMENKLRKISLTLNGI